MRTVLYSDLAAAARVLLAVPSDERTQLSRQLMSEADIADRTVRRTGKMHAEWGNGTLSDAAHRHTVLPERDFGNADYRACFCHVLTALGNRSARASM